ncbi:MAG: sigma-70 family RNA polymerase sigma factor [Candidatus Riflebacteria bacterium]|nr:sigma-70 family RNA polymerase sigma factor [Candidatus Riflebacteria bacterium]
MEKLQLEARLKNLLSSIHSGRSSAIEELIEQIGGIVFAFLLRILENREDAEDAFQETFSIVYRKAGQKSGIDGSPRSWIFTIAKNEAFRILRARKHGETVDKSLHNEKHSGFAYAPDEKSQEISDAVSKIPIDLRISFMMKEILDLSYDEIAVMTDRSVSQIAQEIFRARKMLREILS